MEMVGQRRGQLVDMTTHNEYTYMLFSIPARGLIGFRTRLLNATQGAAVIHHRFDRYRPMEADIPGRATGVLISNCNGRAVAYCLDQLQQRADLHVGHDDVVYEGMIVGENSRSGDMTVNPTREKKLSNMRPPATTATSFSPAAADVAGGGPGVHRRGRTGRGHADADSPAEDHSQGGRSAAGGPEGVPGEGLGTGDWKNRGRPRRFGSLASGVEWGCRFANSRRSVLAPIRLFAGSAWPAGFAPPASLRPPPPPFSRRRSTCPGPSPASPGPPGCRSDAAIP